MKKIIMGFMGLAAVVAVVSTSAYAAWTDKITVSGITVEAGNADLQMSLDNASWLDTADLSALDNQLDDLFPGMEDYGDLYLRNNSSSEIGLNVTMRLTSAASFGPLSNYIWLKIDNMDEGGASTGYHTLASWNAAAKDLPGALQNNNDTDKMRVYVKVDPNTPDSLQNAKLQDMTFEMLGTQITSASNSGL